MVKIVLNKEKLLAKVRSMPDEAPYVKDWGVLDKVIDRINELFPSCKGLRFWNCRIYFEDKGCVYFVRLDYPNEIGYDKTESKNPCPYIKDDWLHFINMDYLVDHKSEKVIHKRWRNDEQQDKRKADISVDSTTDDDRDNRDDTVNSDSQITDKPKKKTLW